jgi:hypothetical protein
MPRKKKQEIVEESKIEEIVESDPQEVTIPVVIEDPEVIQMVEEAIAAPEPVVKDGFNFTDLYQRGDFVYVVRFIEFLDVEEVKKLTIRSVYPRYMIGIEEKHSAMVIGPDMRDLLFDDDKSAKAKLKELSHNKKSRPKKEEDIPYPYADEEDKEDDINGYVDGGAEENE